MAQANPEESDKGMDDGYKEFLAALGAHVRKMRKERGWSLRDMVVLHGYHDSQWRKYESGGGLTIPSLLKIAGLFDMSIVALLDGLGQFPRVAEQDVAADPEFKKVAQKVPPRKATSRLTSPNVQTEGNGVSAGA